MSASATLMICPLLLGIVAEQSLPAHVLEARAVYGRTVEGARRVYAAALTKAQRRAVEERKSELAATLAAEILRVSKQAPEGEVAYRDYLPQPHGDWTIRYSNGHTRHYVFHVNGTGKLVLTLRPDGDDLLHFSYTLSNFAPFLPRNGLVLQNAEITLLREAGLTNDEIQTFEQRASRIVHYIGKAHWDGSKQQLQKASSVGGP